MRTSVGRQAAHCMLPKKQNINHFLIAFCTRWQNTFLPPRWFFALVYAALARTHRTFQSRAVQLHVAPRVHNWQMQREHKHSWARARRRRRHQNGAFCLLPTHESRGSAGKVRTWSTHLHGSTHSHRHGIARAHVRMCACVCVCKSHGENMKFLILRRWATHHFARSGEFIYLIIYSNRKISLLRWRVCVCVCVAVHDPETAVSNCADAVCWWCFARFACGERERNRNAEIEYLPIDTHTRTHGLDTWNKRVKDTRKLKEKERRKHGDSTTVRGEEFHQHKSSSEFSQMRAMVFRNSIGAAFCFWCRLAQKAVDWTKPTPNTCARKPCDGRETAEKGREGEGGGRRSTRKREDWRKKKSNNWVLTISCTKQLGEAERMWCNRERKMKHPFFPMTPPTVCNKTHANINFSYGIPFFFALWWYHIFSMPSWLNRSTSACISCALWMRQPRREQPSKTLEADGSLVSLDNDNDGSLNEFVFFSFFCLLFVLVSCALFSSARLLCSFHNCVGEMSTEDKEIISRTLFGWTLFMI